MTCRRHRYSPKTPSSRRFCVNCRARPTGTKCPTLSAKTQIPHRVCKHGAESTHYRNAFLIVVCRVTNRYHPLRLWLKSSSRSSTPALLKNARCCLSQSVSSISRLLIRRSPAVQAEHWTNDQSPNRPPVDGHRQSYQTIRKQTSCS